MIGSWLSMRRLVTGQRNVNDEQSDVVFPNDPQLGAPSAQLPLRHMIHS